MTRCFREQLPDVDVRHVRDGEEALEYLMQRGRYANPDDAPRPTLLLLDLRLPKQDGFEVLEQIKSTPSLSEIPTVILSTSHRDSDIERAYELDANSYLVKPLDFDKFAELIGQIARFWLAWNRTT
jgi:CheY-like chemotaxis protein